MNRFARLFTRTALTVAFAAAAVAGHAQDAASYPNKPVKIIVPFAPGGGSDFMGRLLAKQLSEKLGQPFIVENKPGAGGNLGAEIAVKSPPDGYTLMLTAASSSIRTCTRCRSIRSRTSRRSRNWRAGRSSLR